MTDFVTEKVRNELVRGRPRSVLAVVVNNTETELKLIPEQSQLGAGAWKQEPVRLLQPHSRAVIISQGSGFLGANRGTVTYSASGNPRECLCFSPLLPVLLPLGVFILFFFFF